MDLGDLNYYFIPVILITLGSFFIADAFFEVYEMAVDTIFLCFLEVRLESSCYIYKKLLAQRYGCFRTSRETMAAPRSPTSCPGT